MSYIFKEVWIKPKQKDIGILMILKNTHANAMFVLVISSFVGFLGTNSRKNWPISQEFSGQTSPKSNQ